MASAQNPAAQTYWATKPDEELGRDLSARVTSHDASLMMKGVFQRVARAYRYYYGLTPQGLHATSQVLREGDVGELAAIRVNHARALLNTLLNLITANKVVWQPKAVNVDYDSLRETELAAAILEYYWREKQVGRLCVEALEHALWATEHFVLVGWDEAAGEATQMNPDTGTPVTTGDLTFRSVPSWDVIRDPNKRSFDDLDWVVVRLRDNRYDLMAQHPDAADAISRVPPEARTARGQPTSGDVESDDIPHFIFLHKKRPALPNGRMVRFLSTGEILGQAEDLEYDELPLYRLSAGELSGTPYGYSNFLDVLGIQEVYDSLHTIASSNLTTLAGQIISIEDGSEVNLDSLAGGLKALYHSASSHPPEALQLVKTPPELYTYLESLKKNQELVFGLNSVVRGEPQSGEQSGSALALLQSQALQQSSTIQANYLRFAEGLGSCVLNIIKARADVPKQIAIVGKANASLVTETTYSKDSLTRVKRVQIEIGNPLSQTVTGRVEIAQDLLEKGLIRTAEQYLTLLKTGNLENLTESLSHELMLIKAENEQLRGAKLPPQVGPPAPGQPPPQLPPDSVPPVLVLDDHQLHMREHRSVLASVEARKNPAVVQAVLQHIDDHEKALYSVPPQMLAAIGQRLPMMPPPGAPTGPGAPGGPPPPAPGGPTPGGPPGLPPPPQPPKQPLTGKPWDPQSGGGAVPPPQP